jgi:hypothetical protein
MAGRAQGGWAGHIGELIYSGVMFMLFVPMYTHTWRL